MWISPGTGFVTTWTNHGYDHPYVPETQNYELLSDVNPVFMGLSINFLFIITAIASLVKFLRKSEGKSGSLRLITESWQELQDNLAWGRSGAGKPAHAVLFSPLASFKGILSSAWSGRQTASGRGTTGSAKWTLQPFAFECQSVVSCLTG